MQKEEAREEGFLVKFNIWRCMGIFAAGVAAFLLWAMLPYDPGDFILRLLRNNRDLLVIFIVALSFATVFLSIEKEKE
ncbi:MAG: hypothetical protein O2U62_03715 [Candidatus Bathyarchaeota archaeon]|jgi:hypothetical protein|nr:hypothetical protein [Candidatus Bathyarchaeota archaeon]